MKFATHCTGWMMAATLFPASWARAQDEDPQPRLLAHGRVRLWGADLFAMSATMLAAWSPTSKVAFSTKLATSGIAASAVAP